LSADEPAANAEPEELIAAAVTSPAVLPNDPFAEDNYLAEDLDFSTHSEAASVAAGESITDRVNEVADWLLLPDEAATPEHQYVCCCFKLSGRNYYLPIDYVLEIAETPLLLPLPLAPAPVSGLVNLRGLVLPVVDLSSLEEHPQASSGVRRLVVVEHQQEKLAFLADGIPYLSETLIGEKIDLPEFIRSHKLKGAEE
jgi:chemotaxis signal transduction protein